MNQQAAVAVKETKEKKEKSRARRGSGSIFRMGGSRFWWVKYYRNCQPIRESSKSELKSVAQALLDTRRKEISQGADPSVANKLTYEDIRKGLLDFYTAQKRHSLRTKFNEKTQKEEPYVWGLVNLDRFFEGNKVQEITTGVLKAYVNERKSDGADGSTVNREFRTLRSAMNIARKEGRILFVPHFPMQKENDARQGFVERPQFNKIVEKLPKHLHPLMVFLYTCGVRIGEAKQILWSQVDFKAKEIHLEGFQTKNSNPRVAPLDDELVKMLRKQFHKSEGAVFDATNLRREWKKAKGAAGFPNLVIHDLRRSAVRNMRKAGISESVAMKISGHKTAHVFRRYDIVDTTDVHEAMDAVSKMNAAAVKAANQVKQ